MMSPPEAQFSMTTAAFSGTASPYGLADSGRDETGLRKAGWPGGSSLPAALLFLSGLVAFSTPAVAKEKVKADAGPKNAVVLVIRHAEKPAKGDGLSKAGRERANAYVRYFSDYTIDSSPLKLGYLFAAADSKESHRPRLTLEPLSKAVGLTIDARFEETRNRELAAAIQKQPPGKQILICWHHEQIPQLLKALRANPDSLFQGGKWPDDVFDWVIQLRYDSDGHLVDVKRINEKLMPGDSDK